MSPEVENIINRDFHSEKPNEKLLTDITEFSIPAGKVYLSPMIDCFDGMVSAWSIGTSPNAEVVNTMLDATIAGLKEYERLSYIAIKVVIIDGQDGYKEWKKITLYNQCLKKDVHQIIQLVKVFWSFKK